MAKKISSRDIFSESDIFQGIRASAEETIKVMNRLKKEVEGTATQLKKGLGAEKMDSMQSIQKIVKVQEQSNKLKKQAIELDKQKSQAEKQKATAEREILRIEEQRTKNAKADIQLKSAQAREEDRLRKIKEKNKKLANDENNAYKKLVKTTRDLKNQSKQLGAELLQLEASGKKNTAQYRKLSDQYKKVTTSAKAGDAQLKKLDKTVGDNFRNVGNYRGALNGLRNGLAQLGLAFGASQIARNISGIIVDFDQAQADLGAISGKTKDELAGLTEQAKILGKTSQFSATQITEMQIELAKLGFTTEQITASTEAVSNFAAATGSDMAGAAKLAGATLRGFGLDASEMDRVVSTLGVATTKSALSFESLNTSMATIAPVANAFDFSVEDTTALLGTLANAGFDASSSATATRNILLNLADANGDLAQELGRPINNLDDLAEGLQELQERGIDLATALELTDKRSVAAFETFLKGSDTLIPFRDNITDVNDELKDMAEKRLDSIQGQVTLLTSAWEGFVLGLSDSTNASNFLKESIGFLARNLNQILTVIGKVVRGFVLYKSTMVLMKSVNFLVNGGFKDMLSTMAKQIPITKAYTLEQKRLAVASKEAGTAVKGFGSAFASVGIFLIITLVTELATAWYDVASGAKEAREETERLEKSRKAIEEGKQKEQENISIRDKEIQDKKDKQFADIEKELRVNKLNAKTRKEEQALEIEALQKKRDIIQKIIDTEEGYLPEYEEKVKLAKEELDRQKSMGEDTTKFIVKLDQVTQIRDSLLENIKEYQDIYDDLSITEKEEVKRNKKQGPQKIKRQKVINTELRQTNEYLSQQVALLQKLKVIEQDRALIILDEKIQKERIAQLEAIEQGQGFNPERFNQLMNERMSLEISNIEQRAEAGKQAIDDEITYKEKKEFEKLTNEREKLITNAKGNQEAIDKINADFNKKDNELVNEQLKRREDANLKKKVIDENAKNDKLRVTKEGLDAVEELNQEADETISEREVEKQKKQYEQINDLVKQSADFFIQQSNRKIAQLDKEIGKAQSTFELLKGLAQSGNIDAKESLAEQQRIINEANKKKMAEEKKQQRIRLAESVFNTYNEKVQSGSENALGDTIRDVSLLFQFINSLPAFFDGTEDTGTNGRGVDGRGGFHAVLHPNERVIPKTLNQQIGDLTNEELTKMAVNYKNGQVIEGASQSASALELAVLVNGLNDIKNEIKNKPETNIELGAITSSMMEVVKSSKNGNTVVYNRFKIRK